MAVLPPVIVPCVEPNHSLTTTAVEPSHSFITTEAEPSHGFDACEDLVLSLNGPVVTSVPLAWILYNSPITPSYYNLYRKKSTDVYYQLLVTNIQANTYSDTAIQYGKTYDYYVRPVFSSGVEGIESNVVEATTPQPQYVYSLGSTRLDIYEISNPTAPAFNSSVGTLSNGGAPISEYADPDYLWINNGSTINIIRHSLDPLHPTQAASFANGGGNIVVRREQSDRNNLLFCFSDAQGVSSYNISDPTNPVLINSQPNPDDPFLNSVGSLAYDSTNHRIYATWFAPGGYTRLRFFPVASDGTLGATDGLPLANIDGGVFGGHTAPCAIIYQGMYWCQWRGSILRAYDLITGIEQTSGFNVGYPDQNFWANTAPRIKNGYLFLGGSNHDVTHQAVLICNLNGCPPGPGAMLWQLGPSNVDCVGLTILNNMLIFATSGNMFYVYDLTGLFATGAIPTLLGSCATSAQLNGLLGYPSDGWDGNDGGCTS